MQRIGRHWRFPWTSPRRVCSHFSNEITQIHSYHFENQTFHQNTDTSTLTNRNLLRVLQSHPPSMPSPSTLAFLLSRSHLSVWDQCSVIDAILAHSQSEY